VICVVAFCSKDADLQRRNLEWALELDGGADHDVVLSFEDGTDISAVEPLARQYFRGSVSKFSYVKPPSDKWPDAPNWAWQNTARFMYGLGQPWLWMEPDVTPLVPCWLDSIQSEYFKGGMPFMGHMVEMADGEHMNGVAVYPHDALDYSVRAMLARVAPWDVVLSKDTHGAIHRANVLFAHAPRNTGITMSVADPRVPERLKQRGSVIFHGCNDGSLIDLLRGNKPNVNGNAKIYELRDIDAKFDEAETHWQREFVRLKKLGQSVITWKQCRASIPSVLEQTPWDCGMFDGLELTEHRVHFNPGLAVDDAGQRWLVTRRWDRTPHEKWHSTLCAHKMDVQMNLGPATELKFNVPPVMQQEDPRVVWHEGHFHVAHCVWEKRRPYAARQAMSRFTAAWKHVDTVFPHNGKNHSDEEGSEKNWIWFRHNDKWMIVYSFSPHVLYEPENPIPHKSPEPALWQYGEIRGGTPPVKIGDNYLTFFHSSLPWKKKQRRYYMGAYMFEALAPFRVVTMTQFPLLAGSDDDPRLNGGPLVVFPCGSLLDKDEWLVTFGVNDEACGWIKIPNVELQQKMTPCI